MAKVPKQTVTIRLPAETMAALRSLVAEKCLSISEGVNLLIGDQLKRNKVHINRTQD